MFDRFKNILLIIITAILLNSCFQDVIDINISESEKQIVIEAVLTDQPEFQYVKISTVGNYYHGEESKPVSGAEVIINSNVDGDVLYNEIGPGVYGVGNFKGVSGITYNLNVNVKGRIFTAKSIMPEAIEIDSLKLIQSQNSQNNPYFYKLVCYFKDVKDVEDYLWFKSFINGQQLDNNTYLYNDRNTDGERIVYDDFGDIYIKPEDRLTLEVFSLDKNSYNYIYSLFGYQSDIDIDLPELFPSNSYNPNTNISNNGLGYFSANAVRKYSVKK